MTPRIFLDALPWDFRSRNTDWRYIRYVLARMTEFAPNLQFVTQTSPRVTVSGNVKAIRAAIGRRIGFPLTERQLWTHRLSAADLRRSGANVVFAQAFPVNAGAVPLVWQSAVLDPAMQLNGHFGVSAQTLQDEIDVKRPLFQRAARVQMFSSAEVQRHRQSFPESADRFVATPYFVPHLRACQESALARHDAPGVVRVLFVGNHALRKGLPQLLDAFLALPAPVLARAHLTVISNFDRSPMRVPDHPRLTVLRGAPSDVVLRHMRDSHILVNVAHFESYGVVFLEAMAQGMACLGPDWEVQREFFDGGRAGVNLPCDASAIRVALERLIENDAERARIGRAAWQRFQRHYAPEHAAARYRALFYSVLPA